MDEFPKIDRRMNLLLHRRRLFVHPPGFHSVYKTAAVTGPFYKPVVVVIITVTHIVPFVSGPHRRTGT